MAFAGENARRTPPAQGSAREECKEEMLGIMPGRAAKTHGSPEQDT